MEHTIRERTEALERQTLSPWACLSVNSKGRPTKIPPCPMRTCFQRDVDRVVHCKSFRRLKHKTQVFLQPEGDHYRTRMTHTLEVSRIARTMARGLALNEDLAEAAALAHAGLSAADAGYIECKLDEEDGRWIYELEFRSGGGEYDYEIDAATGGVLKAELDR